MGDTGRNNGLRTIFSFFLGLMFTVFVGVGVYTFHSPPTQFDDQIKDLRLSEQEIINSKPPNELTDEDRERIQEINRQQRELTDAAEEAQNAWGLSTSIILILFSTLALAVSLVRAEQLQVISNGLLLGGVFTMLYGVGWIVATGTSITRFLVMTIALAVTLGLGYTRFVRRGTTSQTAVESGIPKGEGLANIEHRVHELEERMNEAARALGKIKD